MSIELHPRSHNWLSEEALFRSGLRVCPNNAKEGIDSFVIFISDRIITSYSAVPEGLQGDTIGLSPVHSNVLGPNLILVRGLV